jgi:uncharacterized membrane protein required for colicin V production
MDSALPFLDSNLVTWFLLVVVVVSLYQGIRRGASGSAKQLLHFLISSLLAVAGILLSAWAASALSPHLQQWLMQRNMERPAADANFFVQFGYTAVSGLRDLPLFRFAALFLVIYTIMRLITGFVFGALATVVSLPFTLFPSGGAASRLVGGVIGLALGAGRALLFTAVLFAYSALFPQGPMTDYIQHSSLYREASAQIIRPAAGTLLEEKLPVFAEAMTSELDQLWQRRYDVIDSELPQDIVAAAVKVTEGEHGDEAKARALYNWVGSRVAYDWDKVKAYEERGEWREQNPQQTFATRKGVCIDYARLYAAMARAVNLDVKVVTGLGYDGRGGYGPHAWNEVYLTEQKRWVPLDPTWAQAGNWFDPAGFSNTHIRQA